jgi:transposase
VLFGILIKECSGEGGSRPSSVTRITGICEEMHLNLAYRWFCRLDIDGEVSDHSTFSKNRHGRFRDCDLLRKLFETVVERCMAEGVVGGTAFAVDASLIAADANK